MSDSVQPHRRQPTRLPHPWDYPGKNTGVGCHFLLQCMKVKSESEVAQSCPTLSDPMDCSLPGYSIHGISQARVLEWGAIHTWWHLVILISGGWKIWEVLCTVGLACRFLIYIYNLPIPVTLFAIFPMLFSYPFVWRAPECQKSNSHFFVVRFPSQVSFLFYFELLLDF